ncbi:hypothetical protein [Sphingomonas sp. Leaf242]|uniref:hypothetical protein n=1 Tax=Sphingomonas sp. Leaf242 TaxID=1736304 RepID=UPI0007143377|nr:hypothetical protein [Sphingomonas sp. Leaf242]KQO06913.1 hypothetical protein ASF09_11675 [Sphingomonas sp. Leaf242]
MSLLDKLHALIDPALKETFDKKAYDPVKDRAWVVSRLEAAKTQFASTEATRGGGKKLWKLANGVVAFSPVRKDGAPLVVNGQTTNFIPSERFGDFLNAMIAAVNAGEFDKEFEADTTAGTTVKVRTPRAPRASAGGTGWSEERKAKFAATIAARKAPK